MPPLPRSYALAFGPDAGYPGIISNPKYHAVFQNIGARPFAEFAPTIPGNVFFVFQLMFAVITPALITGAIAERANFPAYLVFTVLWHFLVYCPTAHMVWHPEGMLRKFGILDFAGGLHDAWACCRACCCMMAMLTGPACCLARGQLLPACRRASLTPSACPHCCRRHRGAHDLWLRRPDWRPLHRQGP